MNTMQSPRDSAIDVAKITHCCWVLVWGLLIGGCATTSKPQFMEVYPNIFLEQSLNVPITKIKGRKVSDKDFDGQECAPQGFDPVGFLFSLAIACTTEKILANLTKKSLTYLGMDFSYIESAPELINEHHFQTSRMQLYLQALVNKQLALLNLNENDFKAETRSWHSLRDDKHIKAFRLVLSNVTVHVYDSIESAVIILTAQNRSLSNPGLKDVFYQYRHPLYSGIEKQALAEIAQRFVHDVFNNKQTRTAVLSPQLDACIDCGKKHRNAEHVRTRLQWQAYVNPHRNAKHTDESQTDAEQLDYDLVIYRRSRFGPLIGPVQPFYQRYGLQQTSHNIEKTLPACTNFYWSVRARYRDSESIAFSEWAKVGTDRSQPPVNERRINVALYPALKFHRFKTSCYGQTILVENRIDDPTVELSDDFKKALHFDSATFARSVLQR